uniref:E3 ubiquitin-protein ligase TRIM68-like n=1 Tax=Phascolarctos cinereus TaxID=38626 RepID=A0A6P5JQZ3_PHACI|nr:E3 ubiquitin-protein ligase TRIM68-like [Phascolarctos cinereus]
MDSRAFIENLKADLTCSIDLSYFTDPVTIKCGHRFCKVYLLQCREGANETWTFPECRGVIQDSDLVPTRNLQNLSITSKMLRPHLLQGLVDLTTCDQHGEKEKFFCEEDKTVLCDSCLLAPEHKDCQVLPLETAADKGKDKLQETRTVLQEKEEEFKAMLDEVRRRETRWKEDAETWKQSITCEYEKLHEFLWDEEYQYLHEFNHLFAVLGAQAFTSGKHYWEMDVGDKTEWELGICKDSVSRKGKLPSYEDMRTLAEPQTLRNLLVLVRANDMDPCYVTQLGRRTGELCKC